MNTVQIMKQAKNDGAKNAATSNAAAFLTPRIGVTVISRIWGIPAKEAYREYAARRRSQHE